MSICDLMDCSTPGLPVLHHLPEFAQTGPFESAMPSNHLILCCPLLLPSIFPSIRVFSNESALRLRWPKHWSFSSSISPSSEHPGLISLRMDWLDLLAVQWTLKSLLQQYDVDRGVVMEPMQGKLASSQFDFWYTEHFCIPGVTSVFFSSCDSVVGDALEFSQANRGSLCV